MVDEDNINEIKIQKLVKEFDFFDYYVTSAKTGQGVIEAFNAIIEKLYYDNLKLTSQE